MGGGSAKGYAGIVHENVHARELGGEARLEIADLNQSRRDKEEIVDCGDFRQSNGTRGAATKRGRLGEGVGWEGALTLSRSLTSNRAT